MPDPDLQKKLDEMEKELNAIKHNTHAPIWRSFFTGVLSGLGSIAGAAIALVIIGWILNTVGVIPAFKERVNSWQQTIDRLSGSR